MTITDDEFAKEEYRSMAATVPPANTFAPRSRRSLALLLTLIMGAATCVAVFAVSAAEVIINENLSTAMC
jgi:hypothetical protein